MPVLLFPCPDCTSKYACNKKYKPHDMFANIDLLTGENQQASER